MTFPFRQGVFISMLCGVMATTQAQTSYLDSIRQSIKIPPRDTNDIKSMVSLSAALLHESTFDSALSLAIRARKLSESLNYRKGLGLALLASGYVYRLQGSYEPAIRDFTEALAILEAAGDELNIGKSHNYLAQVYQAMGQPDVAIRHLQLARKFVEKQGHQAGLSVIYLDIGAYYATKANYDVALEYYLLSFKASSSIQAYSKMSMAMNNIGVVYERLADNAKALEYYTKGLDFAVKGGVVNKQAILLINQAGILIKQKKLPEAEKTINRAMDIITEIGDKENYAWVLHVMANLHWKKGDAKKAKEYFNQSITAARGINNAETTLDVLLDMARFMLAEKLTANCAELTREAMEIAREINAREYVKEIYQLNAKLDSTRGDFRGALFWFQKYSVLDDSLQEVRKGANLAYYQEQLQSKEAEISAARVAVREEEQASSSGLRNWLYAGAVSFNATLVLLVVVSVKLRKRNRLIASMNNWTTPPDFSGQQHA